MGEAALRLVDRLGPATIDLIPWQEGSLLDICATGDDGQLAAATAGLVVSRQNGKGGVLEARAIAGVTLPQFSERRILWTAHTWKTAKDAHQRVANIFLSHPDLKARLKHGDERGISYGNDSRSITLKDGAQILFFTRSATAGRGLWADLLICDEALDLTDNELSVLRYTLRTSALRTGRRAQTIYVSTPPDEEKHPNGVVFSRLRQRALAGAPGVCWLEWSVPSLAELQQAAEAEGRKLLGDPRLTDESLWPRGNPSLGFLFDLGTLRSDKIESGEREFLVEGLAAPDYWPDPDAVAEQAEPAIDQAVWSERAKATTPCLDPVVLGIDVSPARVASLVAAGWRQDGRKQGELIQSAKGTAWVVPTLLRIIERVDPAALVLDTAGPAASLVPELEAAGFEVTVTNSSQRAGADVGLVDDIEQDAIRVVPCPPLNAAAEAATWRESGDKKYFNRRHGGGDISALVALSLARFGLLTVAAQPPQAPASPPQAVRTTTSAGVAGLERIADLTTVSF